jgi:hypothetical protein
MIGIWIDFGSPEYDELLALRYTVLRAPLDLEYSVGELRLEYKNLHLAIYDEQHRLLGAAMLVPSMTESAAEMRQVAVLPAAQGKGVGRFLVEQFEKKARHLGFAAIQLAARDTAVAFYQKLGYNSISEPYQKLEISHLDMQKKIAPAQIEDAISR